jgi:hypothetical protein
VYFVYLLCVGDLCICSMYVLCVLCVLCVLGVLCECAFCALCALCMLCVLRVLCMCDLCALHVWFACVCGVCVCVFFVCARDCVRAYYCESDPEARAKSGRMRCQQPMGVKEPFRIFLQISKI